MKTFLRRSLPKMIKYNGKNYVYSVEKKEDSILVLVLSRRLSQMTDIHGHPYQPSRHYFSPEDPTKSQYIELTQDSHLKLKVFISEKELASRLQWYFHWRKNCTLVRLKSEGTVAYDSFIGYLHRNGFDKINIFVDPRISEMVKHWNEFGWCNGKMNDLDDPFFDGINRTKQGIGIVSFTGRDIIYYDTEKVYPDDGCMKKLLKII